MIFRRLAKSGRRRAVACQLIPYRSPYLRPYPEEGTAPATATALLYYCHYSVLLLVHGYM